MKITNLKKLKPVIFYNGYRSHYHNQGLFQQNILLKALEVTSDPEELRKLTGFKTVAEVYRTLDKLAIRKEYHEALLRHGLDLDAIVTGIKDVAENAKEHAVKLKAYQSLLKSLGLDEYKELNNDTKENWEDLIRKSSENNNSQKQLPSYQYDVQIPEVPESEIKRRNEDKRIGESLYEHKQ